MTRLCRSCEAGTCAECANWGAVAPWCEHLCRDMPQQLSLLSGNEPEPGRAVTRVPRPSVPPDDNEVPW